MQSDTLMAMQSTMQLPGRLAPRGGAHARPGTTLAPLKDLAAGGNARAAAAARLVAPLRGRLPAAGEDIAGLCDEARRLFDAGDVAAAALRLAIVFAVDIENDDILLALAVCAMRLERFDEALELASEALKGEERHPRAFCIAGCCQLLRGNRKAAQVQLALAARLARRNPEFQQDLRAAQRLLLILNFS